MKKVHMNVGLESLLFLYEISTAASYCIASCPYVGKRGHGASAT
jgi:hypothetical protein